MVADWGPVVVAVAMFILLSPGLLFQLPARTRVIEFGNIRVIRRRSGVHNGSASIDVNMNSQNENGIERKENKGMNSNRLSIGLHAPKFQGTVITGNLKQKPRLQQYEEYHADENWSPVRH
ncbi:hypothetical protein HAX54_036084 [Datura stramonium]|uniref:Uncharacterized protein n=1 Tax=Datura stramonium TaxID=4076 RepID=A0ABS8VG96_DATST|nr:hypothetical protein [Datura stramonium]